ncbi:MAG: Hint domain-containing protein [Paracoccaceae bacterium]|nr:Hint domain-containing protein [Paracoccaceae bacterium]
MSWIAISGGDQSWVCPDFFADTTGTDGLLTRGSIVIETRISPEGRPQTLLAYQRQYPWPGAISLRVVPGGSITLVMSQGDDVFHTVLSHAYAARTDILRLTFSWDSVAGVGQLALERPDSDEVVVQATPAPSPLLIEDLYTLTRRPQLCEMDDDVVFFAVSEQREPVGPMPSLLPETPVATPRGYQRLSRLRCGDTVRTAKGAVVPVLQRLSRTVPALGSFTPVRLCAPYFGLRQDIIVAPTQRMLIEGTDVEYLFGREAVLAPASSLVNGFAARFETGFRTVTYSHLLLPGHEALDCSGTWLESLYVGRLRRRKDDLARTLLAQVPANLMPEHTRAGLKVLRPFEAITLAEARAA